MLCCATLCLGWTGLGWAVHEQMLCWAARCGQPEARHAMRTHLCSRRAATRPNVLAGPFPCPAISQGYTIWVIRGQLPAEPHPDSVLREGGPGQWLTAAEAEAQHKAAQGLKQQGFLQARCAALRMLLPLRCA